MTHPAVITADPSCTTLYAGLDLGDRTFHTSVIAGERSVVERRGFRTMHRGVLSVFDGCPGRRIVLEAASQSRWMAALLRRLGHDVLMADPPGSR